MIGLNELENTPGVDPVGDEGIVAGLNAILGAGTYAAIDTGVIGTDAIKVGLIYKPASVTPVGAFKMLTSAVDPRFIDTRSRPVAGADVRGERNRRTLHRRRQPPQVEGLGMRLGDPDAGDGQGNCNGTRTPPPKRSSTGSRPTRPEAAIPTS